MNSWYWWHSWILRLSYSTLLFTHKTSCIIYSWGGTHYPTLKPHKRQQNISIVLQQWHNSILNYVNNDVRRSTHGRILWVTLSLIETEGYLHPGVESWTKLEITICRQYIFKTKDKKIWNHTIQVVDMIFSAWNAFLE